MNSSIGANNKTGVKGMYFSNTKNRYVAQVQLKGKRYSKTTECKVEAENFILEKRAELGFGPNHGSEK